MSPHEYAVLTLFPENLKPQQVSGEKRLFFLFSRMAFELLKKWWCSLLLLPFVWFSSHQIYLALSENVFHLIRYNYFFPYNIVYFLIFHFDLLVHEAGHGIFAISGNRFWTILGGSLYQVMFPMLFVGFCWYNRYWKGLQLSLAYAGFSWMSVAGYASDAEARQLPLIGNLGKEAHDWHNIMIHLGTMESYMNFATSFAIIGGLFYISALIVPLFFKEYTQANLDLKL